VQAAQDLTNTVGIRRQPRHSLPRDFRKECYQRRASFPYHGSTDQGTHGNHNRQHQTYGPYRPRPGCAKRIWRRLLLEWKGVSLLGWAEEDRSVQDERYTAWRLRSSVPCDDKFIRLRHLQTCISKRHVKWPCLSLSTLLILRSLLAWRQGLLRSGFRLDFLECLVPALQFVVTAGSRFSCSLGVNLAIISYLLSGPVHSH
jgi:hypothetical protein